MTSHTSPLTRGLATTAAGLLVLASAGFGVTFAWTTGNAHGPALAALTVAMALGLEAAKPIAIAGALSALSRLQLIRAVALGVLGVTAVTYSLMAELSLVATLRSDQLAKREHQSKIATATEERLQAVKNELASLPPVRAVAVLDAELKRLKSTRNLTTCDTTSPAYGATARRLCPQIGSLEVERATAIVTEKLQSELSTAEARIATGPTKVTGDPASAALASYLAALGVTVTPALMFDLLTLVPVLALELGSALALVLVRHGQPTTALTATERVQNAPRVLSEANGPVPRNSPFSGSISCPIGQRLLTYVSSAGGRVEVGQRRLARTLGVSTTRAHGLLHDLAKARVLKLSTGKTGTVIELMSA